MSTSNEGLSIAKAMEILSGRSEGNMDPENQCPCSDSEIPEGAKRMGQSIEFLTAGVTPPPAVLDPNEHMELEEQSVQLRAKLESKLDTMSTKELLQTVLDIQEQRVSTYRSFDEGLKIVLDTGNVSTYPKVCGQATAEFSVLSNAVRSIQKVIQHKDCRRALVQLQEGEKNKLNLTAALHLELVRRQAEDDERIQPLLDESIRSLRSQITKSVESINESIDELRINLMDL